MPRKKKSPFAVNNEGDQLYVMAKYSGISPLVSMIDGLPVTLFGKERVWYYAIDVAIGWHEKELEESGGRSGSQKNLDALRLVKDKFLAGNVAIS